MQHKYSCIACYVCTHACITTIYYMYAWLLCKFAWTSYRNKLRLGDAFVGFQEDTPAAVVFQAYDHLKAIQHWEVDDKMTEEQKDQVKLQLNLKKPKFMNV